MKKKKQDIWQQRYMKLIFNIEDAVDGAKSDLDEQPDEPQSASDEMFVSNDLQVCDNEQYAQDHWGEGKYRRFVLEPQAAANKDSEG